MTPLVGRDAELELLLDALGRAREGRGRVALLAGEPGIGKTRLLEALGERAGRDVLVLSGRCWEAGGAPAYWPWIQVLRRAFRGDLGARAAAGARGAALSLILPELSAGGEQRTREIDGTGEARFVLFDAVMEALHARASDSPLLITLDDLHVADVPSLLLLCFVAREIGASPILVAGAYRDAEARVSPQVGALLAAIERDAARMLLAPLSPAGIAALYASVSGTQGKPDVLEALARVTSGNPLFVSEAARLTLSSPDGQAPDAASLLHLSAGIAGAIRARLDTLPEVARRVLRAGAVLGRDFDLAHLRATLEEPLETLIDALEPALRSRIVVELETARPGYRFSHFLVREALYRDLGAAERARLHAAAARGFERIEVESGEDHATELAHHALLARGQYDVRHAIATALRAGRQALASSAYEAAAAWFERALAAFSELAFVTALEPVARVELLLELADACMRSGELTRAREACLEARASARALGAPELLARAGLTLGAEYSIQVVDKELVAVLSEALSALGTEPSPLRARVMARLAAALQPAADPEQPTALAREAVALARSLGDRPTLARVLHAARAAYMPAGALSERLELDRETLELAYETGQRTLALQALRRLVVEHVEQGDLASAETHLRAYERLAAEERQLRHEFGAAVLAGHLATMRGNFAEARARLRVAEELAARREHPNARWDLVTLRVGLFRAGGDAADPHALLREVDQAIIHLAGAEWVGALYRVLVHGAAEDHRAHRAAFEALDLERLPPRTGGQATLAESCFLLGDARRAAVLEERLAGAADQFSAFALFEGSVAGALALLSRAQGHEADARRYFEAALSLERRAGARPWLARTAQAYAGLLSESDSAADHARAAALREEAGELARALAVNGDAARWLPISRGPTTRDEGDERKGPRQDLDLSAALKRDGDVWRVRFDGSTFHLKATRGLDFVARLLAEPGREFHVLELSAAETGLSLGESHAGPMLDAEARSHYRSRLESLRAELEEAQAWNDDARAARCREALQFLSDELARSFGLGGRSRNANSHAERARINVQRRISDALKRIEAQCPALAALLRDRITTGTFCSYALRAHEVSADLGVK